MSPLVTAAPTAVRADHVALPVAPGARRMPVAVVTDGPLLTKRRPVDFGLVTSCLCRTV
jgi:hypothetical protein